MGVRTVVNLTAPSSADFGAQHMRMLEAMQARRPKTPLKYGGDTKPSIEIRELPHTCSAHEETELAGAGAVHVPGTGKIESPHHGREAAHAAELAVTPTMCPFWRSSP